MENLILKGPPLSDSRIDKGLGEYFFEQAEIHADKIFQIDGQNGFTETYLVTKERSTRVAINLLETGITQKDVVMICCENNLNITIIALASFYIGSYVASVHPTQPVSDVKHALEMVKPRVIFVEEKSIPLIEKSLEGDFINPDIIVIGNSDKYLTMCDMEKKTEGEKSFKPIKQTGSDIIGIIFSSGTTSTPKGIQISNTYVLGGAQTVLQASYLKPGVIMECSTLYWTPAWTCLGATIITGSARLVATDDVTGEQFLQLVEKHKVTCILSICSFTYEITNLPEEVIRKYNTSSLYSFVVIGSTMEQQQMLKLRKLLSHTYVALRYGSTEGNGLVFFDFTDQKAYQEKVSSSGKVCADVQLKIVDLETNKPLKPNQKGEICVKSPFLMSGYYQFEKPDIFDKDGFFKTGDMGYYDEDQYVYITDRIGEVFKYGLYQISPSLIEHTLLTHPSVLKAVVFGVPHHVDTNHPRACVLLKNGAKHTAQELLEFVNSKLHDYQKLRAGIIIVNSIPKTPSGKIQRRTIRDLFINVNTNN